MAERIAVAPIRRARLQPGTAGSSVPGVANRRPTPLVKKRSFRVPEVVLGVLLVAGCALAAVLWQRSTNATTTVVVAARTIGRGSVIVADDLRGAQVGGETSAMIGGESAHALLGRIAVVDIAAAVPLTPTLLTDERPLGADEALTSMALSPGQLPPDLAPNDHVRIVVTSQPDASGVAATAMLDEGAVVWSVVESQDRVSTIVTLRGPISLTTLVASAAQVQLARVVG